MANTDAIRLGRRVRELRESLRLSQRELARRAFVSRPYITHIETGRNFPSWEVIGHLADALGVSRDALVGRDELPLSPERQALQIVDRLVSEPRTIPVHSVGPIPADRNRRGVAGEETRPVNVPLAYIGSRAIDDLFVAIAAGDCLHGEGIVRGTHVLCERTYGRRPADGSIVVVRVGDELIMKLWFATSDGIELRDSDGNVAARLNDRDDFELLGVSIQTWRDTSARSA